jgi:hypothetical protein
MEFVVGLIVIDVVEDDNWKEIGFFSKEIVSFL